MYTPCKIKDLQGQDKNKNLSKASSLEELIENCPENKVIGDNLIKAWTFINDDKYEKIVCSISGGSDSDVMLDIVWRCDKDNKVDYVWFNTGLEYQATKDHLKFLEEKYDIKIRDYRAIKPIPTSCKEYGQPFISKNVAEMIDRLQRHNFQWEDEPLDVLLERYCEWNEKKQDWVGCKGALMWWCNANKSPRFCIKFNKWLKEFMIENPPPHKISSKCCKFAKKDVLHKLVTSEGYELNIFGVRKAEGGIRSTSYKSCFDDDQAECDNYRPLFWYVNDDKTDYENHYDVTHSKCYTEYGLKRTGCAGCPFGQDFEFELEVIEEHEPKLYVAVNNIFKESYEYTRKYNEFYKMKNEEEKRLKERNK